ncbi:antichymotrypsin-2-like [Diabrotica undecimpunctata]|uniref:antichymotrypsin-2-like n=1 Tax=Diabrotica undecimpunctata TaxID=50387 RepID=UPI003B63B0AB
MMKPVIILALIISTTLAAPSDVESPLQQLAIGNQQLTSNVYKEILKTRNGSIIFSPLSVETVLALTSEGAKGDTRSEIVSALHLPESQKTIQQGFKELLPQLKINNKNAILASANKIYVANGINLEDDFKKTAESIYLSGLEQVDFSKSAQAANIINQWVENQTNKKIKDLIKPEYLNSDTMMTLINTLYLSAKWSTTFKDYNTVTDKFYRTPSEQIDQPTMTMTEVFRHYENKGLDTQFLEIPFKSDGLVFSVALPNKKDGIAALENNIEKVFEPQPYTHVPVHLKLPKFTVETELNLKNILQSLGVQKIFNSDAELSGLAKNAKELRVSEVIQKAFIKVAESGVEAAAATAVLVVTKSARFFLEDPIQFFADHPFVYFIKYNNVILFAGKYSP